MSSIPVSPAFRELPPPILIVGMHRSGTSMVVGMLTLMGVFLDPDFQLSPDGPVSSALSAQLRTDGYGEATAFRLLNEAIMVRAGANWFHVDPFLARRDQPGFARASLEKMRQATYRELALGYLRTRPEPLEGPWGWKDPRNSLLLPYWLRLFPEARILHVHRQPEAIVASLVRRATKQAETSIAAPDVGMRLGRHFRHPNLIVGALARRLRLISAPPSAAASLADPEYCLRLTRQYVDECRRYRTSGDRYLEIAYEEILADPESAVARLVDFAQLRPSAEARRRSVEFVDSPRRKGEKRER